MMVAQNNQKCFISEDDEIPILDLLDYDKGVKKDKNILLGCMEKHVTPFVISPNGGKFKIECDSGIIQNIRKLETECNSNINEINKDKVLHKNYEQILIGYVMDNTLGMAIHIRYLIEGFFYNKFYKEILKHSHKGYTVWNSIIGVSMFKILMGKEYNADTNEEKKQNYGIALKMFKEWKKNNSIEIDGNVVDEIKCSYLKISGSVHNLWNDEKQTDVSKKEWIVDDYLSELGKFLKNVSLIKKVK